MSLGVDLVPKKVCSLDCVYCEVGKTTRLTLNRKEYINADEVKEELEHYFKNNPNPDYITFSGYGEPTLNVSIGEILGFIKQKWSAVPVAVLTNGTLLYDKSVRDAILNADLVLPSLDAVTEAVFRKINRPDKDLCIEKYIQGLVDFSKEFKGKIWLEVFILPGYNDTKEELTELKKVILKIKPDSLQLNTLDRPGTLSGLRGATKQELYKVSDYMGFDNVVIISSSQDRRDVKSFRSDVETAILETISRRPCTLDDLAMILGSHVNEINKYLDVLEMEGKIERIEQERGFFYQFKEK